VAKLYVGSLPYGMTDDTLLHLFTDKGYRAVSARVITDRETGQSRGFGFVELGPEDDASKAIGEFNGLNVEGRALQVNEARPQESRGGGRSGGHSRGGGGFSGGRGGRGGRRNY
jgi:RNA recognition motif-containing protein